MTKSRDARKFLKAVGARFHSLRKKHESELQTVAKAVGISPALLVRIERGDYDMYLDLLFKLCYYYEITPHDFFKDVEKRDAII
jgi:transcriptional regulator with XRE-family HTH domain